jgi:hypothetical protein
MDQKEYKETLQELHSLLREIKNLRFQYNEKKEAFDDLLKEFKTLNINTNQYAGELHLLSLTKDYFESEPLVAFPPLKYYFAN